ncbi:(deoxy)nucleoside triphosphate pyrophosphohydrolase [Algibacter mikhailovii]|uniref:(deoxy)nucleoside triphosphate pyrophosphohydrolase n=1 Tax=Algibacter mikhailovii TaxID=425498 RepID=UPI002494549E|nr:(deoxy)nucleoside triphosphate pyrophosphohydrolase [Algibacter mikhailovii]
MIQVVCGIIYRADKIFIARRKEGKSMAGKWEFPGGKVESDESEEMALKRELLEELGMMATVKNKLGSNVHDYGEFSINLVAYKCDFINASFQLTDHDTFEWVVPGDLLNYDLTAADIPLVELFV